MAARLDSDQPAFDRWCNHFKRSIAIRAVQIWISRAFSLVPTVLGADARCLLDHDQA